jgi:hypothetical protein
VKPAATRSAADDHQAILNLKIGLFVMAMLLLVCIYLHRRGTITIYQDYTDALWTTLTPILGIGAYFVASAWLEVHATTPSLLPVSLVVLCRCRCLFKRTEATASGFSFYLFAKVILLTFYFLMMALLLCGGAKTKSEARRRRGWAVLATTVFVFLSGWMCRNRHFSSIDISPAGPKSRRSGYTLANRVAGDVTGRRSRRLLTSPPLKIKN